MSKYKISKEFKILKGMKLPANPGLLPMANAFLELMRGRGDSWVKVEKLQIPGYRGEGITIYVMRRRGLSEIAPCILDIHGGGFMMKASPAHFIRAKEYAYKLNCTVIFPDYRLIPEHPYPTPFEDCVATYRWMTEHAADLKIDTQKIAVLGDSAGGNLAAAVALRVRDEGLPMPRCQMLIYPVLDSRMQTQSMKMYTDTPVWDARLSKLMWELYLKDVEKQENMQEVIGYISPAEAENLSRLPHTYIEVAEFDCLRDEGIAFAEKLKKDGISVELYKVSGSVHGYDVMMRSSVVKNLMRRRIKCLKKYLL